MRKIARNKKGNIGFGYIFGGIIALAIVAIVLYSLFGSGSAGKSIKNFFSFLPSFNEAKQNIVTESVQHVGYDIINSKVKYYNVKWVDFPSGSSLKSNGKEYSSDEFYNTFTEYFTKADAVVEPIILGAGEEITKKFLKQVNNKHGSNVLSGGYSPASYDGPVFLTLGHIMIKGDVSPEQEVLEDSWQKYNPVLNVGVWITSIFSDVFYSVTFRAGDYILYATNGLSGGANEDKYFFPFGELTYGLERDNLFFIENKENSKAFEVKGEDITSEVPELREIVKQRFVVERNEKLKKVPIAIKDSKYCVTIDNNNFLRVDLTKPLAKGATACAV